MNKPQTIQVRRYLDGNSQYGSNNKHEVLETIQRKVYGDTLGNYNRFACRYHGKTHLVHSDKGDIGDPFRADESYLETLFIEADSPCQWNLK